ncbi:MAG TPA: ABC transporter permease [Actinomycetota bacterium]|jgi:putative ABC transport system permease protein|nr:ABC transporter permease [Actinomycetota bacterium]
MMRAIRLLHLKRLRRHPLRSVIAVVAVASGVTLAVTVTVVQSSTQRSFDDYAESLSGPAPLRVIGPVDRAGVPESKVPGIRAVPGVEAAIPMIQSTTLADGGDRQDIPIVALGYDCSAQAIVGRFACDPSAIEAARTYRAPLTSRALAHELGPAGVIRTNLGPKPARGALPVEGLEQINNGRVVAFPIHVAQALFTRLDRVDVVYVMPERGVAVEALQQRLETALGPTFSVLKADEPSPSAAFFRQLYVLLALVGLGTLATGGIMAHNALALSLEERRRDLAVAAAIGGKPRTIVGGALVEGATLGVVGGLLGAVAGILVAYPVLASFQFLTERAAGLTMRVHLSAAPFVTGAVLGALLGLVAAARPARRASRIDVVAELQGRSAVESADRASVLRPVIVLALGVLGMGIAIAASRKGAIEPWQPVVVGPAAILATAAFMSAVGQFAPFLLSAGARLTRRASTPVRLAWSNLVGEGWRSAGMVLAAGGAISSAFMISNFGLMVVDGLADSAAEAVRGQVLVATTPITNNFNLDARPSPALARGLRGVPGVARVRRSPGLLASLHGDVVAFEAFDGERPPYEVIEGTSDLAALERGEIVIGPGVARRYGYRPGGTFPLPGPNGFVNARIQGIVANGDTTGFESSMSLALFEKVWGPLPSYSLKAEPVPGVSTSELARRIEAANLDPNLTAYDEADYLETLKVENGRFFSPFWALQRALVAIAFAAVLSNLLLVALRRKRELGLVAAVGMSSRQLGLMVVMEAAAVGIIALILGTIFSLGATESFRHALSVGIPYPMPLRVDPVAPLLYGAITLAVLLGAASWPAWRTARLNVVDALRYE